MIFYQKWIILFKVFLKNPKGIIKFINKIKTFKRIFINIKHLFQNFRCQDIFLFLSFNISEFKIFKVAFNVTEKVFYLKSIIYAVHNNIPIGENCGELEGVKRRWILGIFLTISIIKEDLWALRIWILKLLEENYHKLSSKKTSFLFLYFLCI